MARLATVNPSVNPATADDSACAPAVPGIPQRLVSESSGVGVVQTEEVDEDAERADEVVGLAIEEESSDDLIVRELVELTIELVDVAVVTTEVVDVGVEPELGPAHDGQLKHALSLQ